MEPAEHLTALLSDGRLFERAVARAGWDDPVPPCPGWSVRDLVVHLGGVHRWVTAFVVDERAEPTSREERAAFGEHPDDAYLAEWFSAGLEGVADALARADPALRCWTIWPGVPPRAFWARRMAHEMLVHRLDAEIAAGTQVTRVEPALAADGVDELLAGFLLGRPPRRLVADPTRTVAVATTDTGDAWSLAIGPDGPRAGSGSGSGAGSGADDLTVRGPAAAVHRLLWNRADGLPDGVTADGDPAVLEFWRTLARI